MKYKCPLCGSPFTESHFHRVIKLQDKKEKVQKGELDKLKKQAAAANAAAERKEQETRTKAKQKIEAADVERRKIAIRDKRMMSRDKLGVGGWRS